jgi:carotene isomerase
MQVMQDADAIVIGSGIGGLVAASLLSRYGWRVLVCESHSIPGGAAHSFSRNGFHFDSGPSFYCGLGDPQSLNPLRQVLDALGESVETVAYDPLGHYHFPEQTLPIYGNADQYRGAIAQITPQGAAEFKQFEQRLLDLYQALREIPALALRADFNVIPTLLMRYPWALVKLLPHLGLVQGSVGTLVEQTIQDPWVRRLIDVECFLLSGLKASGTIAPEVAFMFGERTRSVIDYPVGGSGAIVSALVRGLNAWGGTLRLNSHVEKIMVKEGRAVGIRLRSGDRLYAPVVISNATIWDTYTSLLEPDDIPASMRQNALKTPAVESFMHLHLGIQADGLDHLTGHHVVVHDATTDITTPGNTCMISMPTVWDASQAPAHHHAIHAYTLEPFDDWQQKQSGDRQDYDQRKRQRAEPLFRALERVIPDVRDRITLELIGSPLTHARFLRRYRGTYGPAIAAGDGLFPDCHTPIQRLYRVGDSTLPGIGVPAVAASGILCANSLVEPQATRQLLTQLNL